MAAPHSFSELIELKRAARERALAARAGCDPALGVQLGLHVLAACPPPPGAVVAGFWPLPGEIDLRPLLQALHDLGHVVGLPVTPPRGSPLDFRRWLPGANLARGRFGTLHPESETVRPDWLLVPLLAFDRAGRRLGYGGGYYDRTLATLPGAFALGCGYAVQELDEVPAASYDVRLSAVATEHGVLFFK